MITDYNIVPPKRTEMGGDNYSDFIIWCDEATADDLSLFYNDESKPWVQRQYIDDLLKIDAKTRIGFLYDRKGIKNKASNLDTGDFEIQL